MKLFFSTNYEGKSRNFVEDDLGKRLVDYENVVKDIGFETSTSTLTMVLNSKSLGAFSAASFGSALLGKPIAAATALAGGASIELAKDTIELAKKKHELNKLKRDHELGYLLDLKKELG